MQLCINFTQEVEKERDVLQAKVELLERQVHLFKKD